MEIVFLRTCETPFTTRRDLWHQRRKSALTHSWVDTADARRRFCFSHATHTSMTFELEVVNSKPLYKLSLSDVSRVDSNSVHNVARPNYLYKFAQRTCFGQTRSRMIVMRNQQGGGKKVP